MYDAKEKTKDENLKYNTIADRSYFGGIHYDNMGSIPTSYVPIDGALKTIDKD